MNEKLSLSLEKIDDYRWRIPQQGAMRTDGIVYADSAMISQIKDDQSLLQVAHVACLPGIVGNSLAMPDIHWGYGFPIGGVAAFDMDSGVVSPGGVGYDINCGVRLMQTALTRPAIEGKVRDLVDALFINIPSGVGSKRKDMKLSTQDEKAVFIKGARWAVEHGFGYQEDLGHIEEQGAIADADPDSISAEALERGRPQLGTLGSGNHFVEIDYVEEIYDSSAAEALGLYRDTITITIHSGSRGLGYQICDDFIKVMLKASQKYGIVLPDKQLCCAPIKSAEGRNYLAAMACAANYAFANRQMMTHWVRESFERVLGARPKTLQMKLVYDVCHNIAKIETHTVDGKQKQLCIHRKGATRAFPAHHPQVPEDYKETGQPVLIPGDMGRCSYILVGTSRAMNETFGSSCHGAGRVMSRHQAIKAARGRSISREMENRGIYVRAAGRETLVEEIPDAYKDVSQVVEIVHNAGIGKKVVKLKPLGVMKG
jgi:tRNA-splicing ligase RtcB